jgi:ABC-2 type transport system permease protein
MWAIIKKEVKTYFLSPIGYVFIGVFLLAFSISFNLELEYSSGVIDFENIFIYIFTYLPTILVFAFLIPMLTMRTFSEERKNGTEQLLLTSPVSITRIVLAKFLSALIIVVIALLFTLMYIAIICFFGTPDFSTALVTMLGFLLLNMAYIAFGVFASSLTENQIIAAMISIVTFVVSWVLPEFITEGSSFSLLNMFYKFTTGQINIAYVITYLAFTVLCLILTITVMQRRKSAR